MTRSTTGEADLEPAQTPASDRDEVRLDADEFGVHVDGEAPADEAADPLDEVAETVTDVVDALAAAFNERDAEAVLELVSDDVETPGVLGSDRAGLVDGLEGLWHRRPACCLTRGRADDEVVGVLWDHDGSAWWAVATVHLDDVDDDGRIGVLEISDDPGLLDRAVADHPGDDLEEGSRWVEWEDGEA